MSDGAIVKADKDFTKDVDKQLPEAEQLAQVCYRRLNEDEDAHKSQNSTQAAIDKLLVLEKQTRQVSM